MPEPARGTPTELPTTHADREARAGRCSGVPEPAACKQLERFCADESIALNFGGHVRAVQDACVATCNTCTAAAAAATAQRVMEATTTLAAPTAVAAGTAVERTATASPPPPNASPLPSPATKTLAPAAALTNAGASLPAPPTTATTTAPGGHLEGCHDQGAGEVRRGKAYTVQSAVTDGTGCAALCAKDGGNCVYYSAHRVRGCSLFDSAAGALAACKGCVAHGICKGTPSASASLGPFSRLLWQSPSLASATAQAAVPLPANCRRVPGTRRLAYRGKVLGPAERGLRGNACAAKCAATPRCGYWISHVKKGCVLKYWGLASKKVYGDAYEAHGTCTETVAMDPGCALIEQTTPVGGDGYRGKRVMEGYDTEVAATSRSTGSCSQLCRSTAKCTYWVVHNAKGCLMHENAKAARFRAAWKPKGYLAHGTCNGDTAPGAHHGQLRKLGDAAAADRTATPSPAAHGRGPALTVASQSGRVVGESETVEVDGDVTPGESSVYQASATCSGATASTE